MARESEYTDCVIRSPEQAPGTMQPSAIVMDMDGTLLDAENKIIPATREYLIEMQKRGSRLVLASGRSYTRLLGYAKELQMDKYNGLLIEIDGVAIYDLSRAKRTKFRMMSPEEIHEVFDWLTTQNAESQAMFDDGLFDYYSPEIRAIKERIRKEEKLSDYFPWTAGPWNWLTDFRDGYGDIRYVKSADEINRPINKIQIMQEEKPLEALYEQLQEKFGSQFSIYRTTPRQLEILPLGFSKGEAIRRLIDQEGWKPEDVVVFGDGENDCSMFEAVPLSYAMGNARDYVRDKAARVTDTNLNEGIRTALQELTGVVLEQDEPESPDGAQTPQERPPRSSEE